MSSVPGMIVTVVSRSLSGMFVMHFICMIAMAILRMLTVSVTCMIIVAMSIVRLIELLCLVPVVLFTGRKAHENGEDASAKDKRFHYAQNPYPTLDGNQAPNIANTQ